MKSNKVKNCPMTEKFNELFTELKSDVKVSDDVDFYRWIFDQAVAFALKQQPVTKSALTTKNFPSTLQSFTQQKEQNMQINLPSFPSQFIMMLEADDSVDLTQAEIQTLQFVLRTILNHVGIERSETKRLSKVLFNLCDKEKPETEEYFNMLNNVRNTQRKQREFYLKLSKIQNKIKKLQKY